MTENSKLGGAPSWNLDPFAGSAGVFNIFLLRFIGGVKARSERKLIDTYLYRRNIIPVFIFASSRSYVRCGRLQSSIITDVRRLDDPHLILRTVTGLDGQHVGLWVKNRSLLSRSRHGFPHHRLKCQLSYRI